MRGSTWRWKSREDSPSHAASHLSRFVESPVLSRRSRTTSNGITKSPHEVASWFCHMRSSPLLLHPNLMWFRACLVCVLLTRRFVDADKKNLNSALQGGFAHKHQPSRIPAVSLHASLCGTMFQPSLSVRVSSCFSPKSFRPWRTRSRASSQSGVWCALRSTSS